MCYNIDNEREVIKMKKSFIRSGIKFVVKYDGSTMIHIYGYEKFIGLQRPTEESGFWIRDYETIEEGVENCVKAILDRLGLGKENEKKLKEYFN